MKGLGIEGSWVKRAFWLGAMATLLVFLVNFYLVGFGVYGDGIGYYTPLRSLLFDGNLKVADEYEILSQSASKFGGGIRVSGPIPEYSKYTIGLGLVLSPFFLLGHGAAVALRSLGVSVEANGLSWPYELAYCLGSLGLGLAGLRLCYRGARRYFSPLASALAVAGVWFASPLTFYLSLEVSMSHAASQFLVSSFLYFCLATPWEKRPNQQVLLGLLLGLAALVRPQNLLFGVVPILMAGWGIEPRQGAGERGRQAKGAIAVATIGWVALLAQLPQVLVYQWQFGSLFEIPYLEEGAAVGQQASFHWGQPQIANVLFSGFHGLFTWHPLLFLAVVGLAVALEKLPRLAGIWLVAFGLQVYFVASWWSWWQGASFGGRMFCNCSFLFSFGLAALWDRFPSRSWQRLGVVVTASLIVWNALLVLQYESGMIPPEAPVPIPQLIENQFSAIPFFLNHVFNR